MSMTDDPWHDLGASDWSADHVLNDLHTVNEHTTPTTETPVTTPATAAPQTSIPVTEPTVSEPAAVPTGPTAALHDPIARYRRRGGGIAGALVIVGLGVFGHSYFSHPSSETPAQKAALNQISHPHQASPQQQAEVTTVVNDAAAYHAAHGSFSGWTPPKGASATVIGPELAFTDVVNGTCYWADVVSANAPIIATDPTGFQCSQSALAQHQQAAQMMGAIGGVAAPALPAPATAAAAPTASPSPMASATSAINLDQAATDAQISATNNDPKNPTFPANLSVAESGVSVKSVSPSTAVLQENTSSGCLQVTVSATGSYGSPAACS